MVSAAVESEILILGDPCLVGELLCGRTGLNVKVGFLTTCLEAVIFQGVEKLRGLLNLLSELKVEELNMMSAFEEIFHQELLLLLFLLFLKPHGKNVGAQGYGSGERILERAVFVGLGEDGCREDC